MSIAGALKEQSLLPQLDLGEKSAQQQQRAQPHFCTLRCQVWERHTFSSRGLSHPLSLALQRKRQAHAAVQTFLGCE